MKTETAQHTPTPWKIEPSGHLHQPTPTGIIGRNIGQIIVSDSEGKANAAFIRRAVNAHEELLQCLKGAMMIVNALSSDNDTVFVKEAEQAIAKAEGR